MRQKKEIADYADAWCQQSSTRDRWSSSVPKPTERDDILLLTAELVYLAGEYDALLRASGKPFKWGTLTADNARELARAVRARRFP